jgi:hypothetical protein
MKELLCHSSVSVTMRNARTNREGKMRVVRMLGDGSEANFSQVTPENAAV